MEYEAPDLSHMSIADLLYMARECMESGEPSDLEFARACKDELARRKPEGTTQGLSHEQSELR